MAIYVVDIDGTICTKTKNGTYQDIEPFPDRIEKLNKLQKTGNSVIYFTARGMGRYRNNAFKATQDFYELTEKQLEEWGAQYSDLYLGKPAADFYIDDKAINDNDFFGE